MKKTKGYRYYFVKYKGEWFELGTLMGYWTYYKIVLKVFNFGLYKYREDIVRHK